MLADQTETFVRRIEVVEEQNKKLKAELLMLKDNIEDLKDLKNYSCKFEKIITTQETLTLKLDRLTEEITKQSHLPSPVPGSLDSILSQALLPLRLDLTNLTSTLFDLHSSIKQLEDRVDYTFSRLSSDIQSLQERMIELRSQKVKSPSDADCLHAIDWKGVVSQVEKSTLERNQQIDVLMKQIQEREQRILAKVGNSGTNVKSDGMTTCRTLNTDLQKSRLSPNEVEEFNLELFELPLDNLSQRRDEKIDYNRKIDFSNDCEIKKYSTEMENVPPQGNPKSTLRLKRANIRSDSNILADFRATMSNQVQTSVFDLGKPRTAIQPIIIRADRQPIPSTEYYTRSFANTIPIQGFRDQSIQSTLSHSSAIHPANPNHSASVDSQNDISTNPVAPNDSNPLRSSSISTHKRRSMMESMHLNQRVSTDRLASQVNAAGQISLGPRGGTGSGMTNHFIQPCANNGGMGSHSLGLVTKIQQTIVPSRVAREAVVSQGPLHLQSIDIGLDRII